MGMRGSWERGGGAGEGGGGFREVEAKQIVRALRLRLSDYLLTVQSEIVDKPKAEAEAAAAKGKKRVKGKFGVGVALDTSLPEVRGGGGGGAGPAAFDEYAVAGGRATFGVGLTALSL